jgi:hypothetical protein
MRCRRRARRLSGERTSDAGSHAAQPLWLQWFLNPENTDEAALRAAQRVVPDAFWPSVERDISRALAALITTLERKRDLLAREGRRRAASSP